MQEFKEFQGKSLDEAIRMACNYFDAPREKLEIDLVQDAKTGIFGLMGMRNAIIRARRSQIQSTINNLLDDGKTKKPKQLDKQVDKQVDRQIDKQLDKTLGEPKLEAKPSRKPKKVPKDLDLDDSIGNRIEDPLPLDDELLDSIGNCEPKPMREGQPYRDAQNRGGKTHGGAKFLATERLDRTHWDHPKPVPIKKPEVSRPDSSRSDGALDVSRSDGIRADNRGTRTDTSRPARADRQNQPRPDPRSEAGRPNLVSPNRGVTDQAKPEQTRSDQVRPDQVRPDSVRSDQMKLERPARPERQDRPEHLERPARPERQDRPEHLEQAAKPDQARSERPENMRTDAEAIAAAAEALAAFKALDKDKLLAEAKHIAQGIMACILGEVPIEVSLQPDRVLIQVDCGEDSGLLIGREGMTLASLQYISSRMLSRSMDASVRVQFDIGDYRERQDDRLYDLAFVLAARVRQNGRPVSTKPLSSYHRRVIHMALQNEPDLFTRSFGDGALKRVIIQKKR